MIKISQENLFLCGTEFFVPSTLILGSSFLNFFIEFPSIQCSCFAGELFYVLMLQRTFSTLWKAHPVPSGEKNFPQNFSTCQYLQQNKKCLNILQFVANFAQCQFSSKIPEKLKLLLLKCLLKG